jgi:glycosyltransferase involved in cell wall biosynthesis
MPQQHNFFKGEGYKWSVLVVIPVFNHPQTIGQVVQSVLQHDLPCLLVDDGSNTACAQVLDQLAATQPGVSLLRLAFNQGKGAAVMAGLRHAAHLGFTHALQIDADGQHQLGDIPLFTQQSQLFPTAVICGCPVYDASVPKVRFYARYLTHILVWVNCLSLAVRDSMCGFRVYPLKSVIPVIDRMRFARRMAFDSEVIVRLHWQGVPVVNQPTAVKYPKHGVSHYLAWRDTLLIAFMHARLFLGMLWRAPQLLWRKLLS